MARVVFLQNDWLVVGTVGAIAKREAHIIARRYIAARQTKFVMTREENGFKTVYTNGGERHAIVYEGDGE